MEQSSTLLPRQAELSRNLGVDLLRCIAMWMIACLHVVNRGGVAGAVAGSTGASLLFPLRVVVSCGVNIYALISGYVTIYGRFRPSRVFELWLQVFFWNMLIACFGELIQPHIMDGFWIRYILPLTQKCFWYFTAYVGVYAFSPLINRGIKALKPNQCGGLICLMLLLFSLGSTVGYMNQGDPWSIGAGYSVLWLLALYVVGACVRHGALLQKTAWWKLLLAGLFCVFSVCVWCAAASRNTSVRFWKEQNEQLLYYTGPALAVFSLCMLAMFSRIRTSGFAAKLTRFFAPLTFGVYIIHVHHVNWTWIENSFRTLGKLPALLVIPAVLCAGLVLFLVCALLDLLRNRLFRLLHVRPLLDRLEARIMARIK